MSIKFYKEKRKKLAEVPYTFLQSEVYTWWGKLSSPGAFHFCL